MAKKVLQLNSSKVNGNLALQNNRANIFRLEIVLNELEELNVEKQNNTISITEYYLRKSKIIKKLYSQDN